MTLEELIQEAAAGRNGLTHLSVIPRYMGTKLTWIAAYAPSRQCSHNIVEHADPVEALKLAISTWKAAKNVTPKELPDGTSKPTE